jgi:hypothetical protein
MFERLLAAAIAEAVCDGLTMRDVMHGFSNAITAATGEVIDLFENPEAGSNVQN